MKKKESLPLLPGRLARDSVEELKAYVRSYLYARQADTAAAIEKTLFEDEPIFKGPFVELAMPFRVAPGSEWPLDPRLQSDFAPYHHQMAAFKRLHHRNSQNTLVTTGTGSGKSECFILPILDYVLHCKEIRKGEGGVKALILYPMNALIADQGERLCRLANGLGRGIRVGKYTGNAGFRTMHDPDRPAEIIDDRGALCHEPPDILLTNYRMLDLMLFRPEEQTFWGKDTRDVFKYLVLDELHTFDGAQGADVAGLIRRLRLKLATEFTCVGTSATIASGPVGKLKDVISGQEMLCTFASTLFGSQFQPEDVIVEPRVSPGEFFTPDPSLPIPKPEAYTASGLITGKEDAYTKYLTRICQRWQADLDPVARGEWIKRHPLAKEIYEQHRGKPIPELAKICNISEEDLYQFLDLLASARRPMGPRLGPLIKLETQLWVAEVPYMIRKLSPVPEFRSIFERDEVLRDYLPAVNCRSCGLSGWVAKLDESRSTEEYLQLADDISAHVSSLFTQEGWVIFPDHSPIPTPGSFVFDPDGQALVSCKGLDLKDKQSFSLHAQPLNLEAQYGKVYHRHKRGKAEDKTMCPGCEEPLSLSLTSLGSSITGSILTGLYLAHGANPSDKKYLIFNDSVQDAAHQAGYISARSFRFNLRRLMWGVTKEQLKKSAAPEGCAWTLLRTALKEHVTNLWQQGSKGDQSATQTLAQIIPQDLWEYWESQNMGNPLRSPDGMKQLTTRLDWEFWVENTVNQDLGWSLRKAQLLRLQPTQRAYEQMRQYLTFQCAKHGVALREPEDSFLRGIIDLFLRQGVAYHPDLSSCYSQKQFSLWPLRNQSPHLAAIFNAKGRRPRVLSLEKSPAESTKPGERQIQYLIPRAKKGNRLTQWAARHMEGADPSATKVISFLTDFFAGIATADGVFRKTDEKNGDTVVLDLEKFNVTQEPSRSFRCSACGSLRMIVIPDTISAVPCAAYHCLGTATAVSGKELADADSFAAYLAQLIDRVVVAPFAHPHTGQLDREKREAVEKAFKDDLMPGDLLDKEKGTFFKSRPINVLTCTPTMEMGIDIGSLSGVMLRGFPRSLSNTKQRLGRSGRSSGNSLNFILVGRSSHDRQFWQNPDLYFRGQITPPGCDFRTIGFLERHFNALLFDLFSKTTDGKEFPKKSDLGDQGLFLDHEVWVMFREHLDEIDRNAVVTEFVASVRLMDHTPEESFYTDLRQHLLLSLQEQRLWRAVEKVLRNQDSELSAARTLASRTEAVANAEPREELAWKRKDEAEILGKRRDRLADSEFIFGVLAGEGILPNYAFPEAGVSLDAQIQIPRPKGQGRAKQEKIAITRAPLQALRELVPGKHFYVQGFKIPITRVIPPAGFAAEKCLQVLCDRCGAVSPADKGLTGLRSACPKCQMPDQEVAALVPLKAVLGDGSFDALQIRDDEELRERRQDVISIMIDYNSTQTATDGEYACWEDSDQGIILEFRTAATIHAVARGPSIGNESQYYSLCPQCLGVPLYYDKHKIAQFQDNFGRNRHSGDCEHRAGGNHVNIENAKVAFGHRFVSDALRFHVHDIHSLPAAKAALMLMMRLALKGNPGHIQTFVTFLRDHQRLTNVILTLYDSVPGGSGHLRAFMQFGNDGLSRETSGLRLFQKRCLQVRKHIQSCPCANGCYNCLYTYDNQYEHHRIEKAATIEWLQRYMDAVWTMSERPINEQMVHNPVYDNRLENDFFDMLAKPKLMEGITRSRIEKSGGMGQRIYLQLPDNRQVVIERTADSRVSLQGLIPYTKPDFTVREKDSQKLLGYVYTDGAQVHLACTLGKKSPFIGTDIITRTQLESEYLPRQGESLSRVATFSYNMVAAWKAWMENPGAHGVNKDPGETLYQGKKSHPLLCLLLSIYGQPDSQGTSWQTYLKNAQAAFLRDSLSHMMGLPQKSSLDGRLMKQALAMLAARPGEAPKFGALQLAKTDQILIFEPDAIRAGSEAMPAAEIVASWELYWMLWQISPNLVTIKSKPRTKKQAPVVTIDGFDDLSSKHQKDLVMALVELGIAPDDLYADHQELALIAVPFASCAGRYALIDVIDLTEVQDIPETLKDGTVVELIDFQKETSSLWAAKVAGRLKEVR